jgi:DNA polymerase-3 subunit gamma/tau
MDSMSYVVLARKYRPRSFAEMVGQPHVVQALGNALERQRLHHAYLFTGTRGIGKTTISRILAKSLNCSGRDGQGGITAQPCGVCAACTAIDADRFVDYIELDAASNRSIEEVRDLIERAAYKPAVGRFKVFMIDEAHQLTKDAFNALLKTLEEPPEYLKFVLATTDPQKMLPTVLSRCLQFNLRPMAPETVQAHLDKVLQAEGVACEPEALRLLGRAARGSMRDALSLTDQAIAYGGGRVDAAVVRAMLGAVDDSHPLQLLQALAQRDAQALLAGVDALRAAGLSAAALLEAMAALLQQAAVEQALPGALDDADPQSPGARALAAQMPADELQLLYSILVHGRGELTLMSDEYGALTMVLLRLFAFPAAGSAAPRPAREQALRAPAAPSLTLRPLPVAVPTPGPTPGPTPVPSVEPTPADVAVSAEPRSAMCDAAPDADLGGRWQTLVTQLIERGAISTLARELAWQSALLSVDGARWTLQVERETLRAPALADRLAAALGELLGHPVSLVVVAGVPPDSPARREAADRERLQRQAEATIKADPLVLELQQRFPGTRLVPGSVKPV